MTTQFVVTDEVLKAMNLAGVAPPALDRVSICQFQVGDIVTFPSAPLVAFRVASRWYRGPQADPNAADWIVTLESGQLPGL